MAAKKRITKSIIKPDQAINAESGSSADKVPARDGQKTEIVFVLGMHRSGTSLMGSALHRLGLYMGYNLMKGNEYNRNGYFEDKLIIQNHQEIMRFYESKFSDQRHLFPLPEKWWLDSGIRQNTQALEKYALSQISAASQKETIWAFKNPLTGRLMEFWFDFCERHGVTARIVYCYRDTRQVSQSLFHRDKCSAIEAEKRWLVYNLDILLFCQKYQDNVFPVNYMSWYKSKEVLINDINKFVFNKDVFESIKDSFEDSVFNSKFHHNKSINSVYYYDESKKLMDNINYFSKNGQYSKNLDTRLRQYCRFREYASIFVH